MKFAIIPVSDVVRWNAAAPILVRMLNFLTGDRWMIQFRARPPRFAPFVPQPDLIVPPFTGVSLFSGGLDSLIGAIDQLETKQVPLLVSHAGRAGRQQGAGRLLRSVKEALSEAAVQRLRTWMAFPKNLVRNVASEDSTRGRSFLFFALGVFAGTGLRRDFVLHAPENGLIALDVSARHAPSRRIEHTDDTPVLYRPLEPPAERSGNSGRIENPYWDKTKGEMVRGCANPALLKKLVPVTLSCASPTKGRWQGHGTQHCGYCLPCLIRRASLASITDPTTYTVPNLRAQVWDPQTATGEQIRSFQYAVDRLHARPGIEKLLIHKPGPLTDNPQALGDLAAVYKRGLEEVWISAFRRSDTPVVRNH